jgi:phosphoglycerate kinase
MSLLEMKDLDLTGKRVMIREDLNVPLDNGLITNDARIKAALPTVRLALAKGAAVILVSHLGRPKEGCMDPSLSLSVVATRISELMGHPVRFLPDWLEGISIIPGEIVLCENVRFNSGEQANDATLSKKMARLCDVFVMDAFGTAHRAQASTHGVAYFAPIAAAGPLLIQELEALTHATKHPKRPVLAIVGGSKISSKLSVLMTLCQQVDYLICGGGIANTLMAADGIDVGRSLYEKERLLEAKSIQSLAKQHGCELPLPIDVVVAKTLNKDSIGQIKSIHHLDADDMILDIGPKTMSHYQTLIEKSRTIIWNGPVGVFEIEAFSQGTQLMAESIAKHDAYSMVGGGDTIAAIEQFGVQHAMSYISTGGGAFLEFLEGKTLPAVDVLERRSHEEG